MKQTPDFSSRFRILKGGKISLVVSALMVGSTVSFALPTGGQVSSGSATINQTGAITTINQSTDKVSINWQSFNIAPNETVNFVQPSASSIILNRVAGTTNSLIEGAMNANGQVFLINPNGIVFAHGSQVNVGGLVASTRNMTDANFQAGNYVFEGNSQNGVLNMGTITAAQGGYVAMMGKTVVNEGTIVATMGNIQLAGGDKISLNLNGNSLVKLTIDQGTLNALVENKGLIQADGGQVYLTTQALNTILDGMVNNTGIIEAKTLNDVTGNVVLYAHGGTVKVGGEIKAESGFVETSGKEFVIDNGVSVKAGQWLIDPVNITIDSTLAAAIALGLTSGNVKITTDTTDGTRLNTTSAESGTEGNINVNSAIAWSSNNTLTLSAYNNIYVNENITHTGTSAGGVIFLYGQGTADGGASTYTLANTKTVTSPSLQWRKGSDVTSTRYAIVDGNVFLGGKYIELGINSHGGFGTGSVKPSLFFGRQGGNSGIGMVGDADGFNSGADLRIDYFMPGTPFEGFNAVYTGGTDTAWSYRGGTAVLQLTGINPDGKLEMKTTSSTGNLQVLQTFTMGLNDKYFNNTVQVSNTGSSTLDGVNFARSFDPDNTRDMGGSYSTINKIEQLKSSGDSASVVSATSIAGDNYATASGSQSKIIYYATDSNVKVGYGNGFFSGTIATMLSTIGTLSKGSSAQADAGIGLVYEAGSLAAGGSKSFSYLTSLDNRDMSTILAELNTASGSSLPTPPPTSAPVPNTVDKVITTIVNSAVNKPVFHYETERPTFQPVAENHSPTPVQTQTTAMLQTLMPQSTDGSTYNLVGTTDGVQPVKTLSMEDLQKAGAAQGISEIRVPLANDSLVSLVNGGLNLPVGVSQEFYVVNDTQSSTMMK